MLGTGACAIADTAHAPGGLPAGTEPSVETALRPPVVSYTMLRSRSTNINRVQSQYSVLIHHENGVWIDQAARLYFGGCLIDQAAT